MEKFLPDYLNYDIRLPHDYNYQFNWFLGLLKWEIKWNNIKYKTVELDISDV